MKAIIRDSILHNLVLVSPFILTQLACTNLSQLPDNHNQPKQEQVDNVKRNNTNNTPGLNIALQSGYVKTGTSGYDGVLNAIRRYIYYPMNMVAPKYVSEEKEKQVVEESIIRINNAVQRVGYEFSKDEYHKHRYAILQIMNRDINNLINNYFSQMPSFQDKNVYEVLEEKFQYQMNPNNASMLDNSNHKASNDIELQDYVWILTRETL